MLIPHTAVCFGRLAAQTLYVETPGTDKSKPKKQALTVQGPVANSRISSPVMGRMATEKEFVAEFYRTVAGYPELTRVTLEQEPQYLKAQLHTPDLRRTKMCTVLPSGAIPNLSHANLTAGEVVDKEIIWDAIELRNRLIQAMANDQASHQDRFEKLQRTEAPGK